MAKHTSTRHIFGKRQQTATAKDVVTITPAAVPEKKEPSARTKHLIEAIRGPFTTMTTEFQLVRESMAELAPKFIKAFAAYQQDTGLGFVPFVRYLDPELPLERDLYANHPSYNAAMNLKRLGDKGEQTPKKQIPAAKRPATPLVALARLVATLLPLVDTDGVIWESFVKEIHWSKDQAERLQTLANKEKPIPLAPQRFGAIRRRLAVNE